MKRPTALFFDLDNTLIDDDAHVLRAIAQALDVVRPSLPGLNDDVATETYLHASNTTWNSGVVNAGNAQELRLGFWRTALATAGCDDDALCTLARDSYMSFRSRLRREETLLPYDDVLPALEALSGRFRLAIISNGTLDTQQAKLDQSNLARHFELVVTSDHFQRGKPDPAMFRHALEALSLDASSVWHIGDGILTDVPGALGAGMTAVWLNRTGAARAEDAAKAHYEIASLSEIATLIEAT